MRKSSSFVFVVLHYLAIEETIGCIDSIKKYCNGYDYHIVVVDNKSPNLTGGQLEGLYENEDNVTVLLSEKNEGFARGNNKGIDYSNEYLDPDFIIVLNNDIQINSISFCRKIQDEYRNSKFSILGPKIILPNGLTERYPFKPMPRDKLVREMLVNIIKLGLLYTYVYGLYLNLKMRVRDGVSSPLGQMPEKLVRQEDVVLHGSCLIFSRIFFENMNGFDARTFMYKEEQLLYLQARRRTLRMIYNPEIIVKHNEGASTSIATGSNRNKLIFLYKNQLRSSFVLIRETRR